MINMCQFCISSNENTIFLASPSGCFISILKVLLKFQLHKSMIKNMN